MCVCVYVCVCVCARARARVCVCVYTYTAFRRTFLPVIIHSPNTEGALLNQ